MEEKHIEENQGNEEKKQKQKATPAQIAAITLSSIAIIGVAGIFLMRKEPESPAVQKIGMEAGIITNEDDIADLELNEPFSFTTLYDRDIYITNGKDATCYIGNSDYNYYEDMYIQIYLNDEDDQMSEEIYVSQIIPRGSHIESFTAKRDLEPGDYRGTLIHSCVDEEGSLVGDTPVIVEIHVTQ